MYLCIYIATNQQTVYLDWLQAVLESNSRCARKWRLSELRDALGGRDRVSLEMHWQAEVKWTDRCTWRPWSIEFGHALGGRDRVNSEMYFVAVIERVWTCTWRPRWNEFRDALWGRDWVSLEMRLSQAMIEWDWSSTWRWSIWRRSMGGAPGAETLLIS